MPLAPLLSWAILLGAGCPGAVESDEAEGTGAGTADAVTFLGTFDPNLFCDRPEVVAIELQATRVGCVPGPPSPCTLPATPEPISGDRLSCPVTDPQVTLGVEVSTPGGYAVAAVGLHTAAGTTERCLVQPDGRAVTEIDAAQIEAGVLISLTPSDAACP
jgi:hypothetical protein